jgi:hypothetical protein
MRADSAPCRKAKRNLAHGAKENDRQAIIDLVGRLTGPVSLDGM